MRGLSRHGVGLVCLALLALAGCTKERTFTADEFVEEVSAEGVQLNLGQELTTTEAGAELYVVELEPLPGVSAGSGEGPPKGSLAVYEDTAGASDRLDDCRNAADLLCYQAANVVVILEHGGIEADRLGVAMKKLAD